MKKICSLFLCICCLLAGCAAPAAPQKPVSSAQVSQTAVTFTDALGRQVTADRPARVAALIGSFADIWCLSGGKNTLCAAAGDTWTQFDLNLEETVLNLGGVKNPNLELLAAAQPDLILASSNTPAQVALLDTFEQLGWNVAYFTVSSFEEYLNMLDVCTRIIGCSENYTRYGSDICAQVEAARQRADGSAPRVLYIRATGSSCKVKNSHDSVLGEMLADLGCVNIADRKESLLEHLSMEIILQEDPEYIFVILQGSDPSAAKALLEKTLLTNPAWATLRAVKEDRFYVMDPNLYNLKPNARWGEAYEKLSSLLYP